MNYSEVLKILHTKYNSLSSKEVKLMVDTLFDLLRDTLKSGNKIEIRGFGIFELKQYDKRKAFNPKILQHVDLPDRAVPFYKASSVLKKSVNHHLSNELDKKTS